MMLIFFGGVIFLKDLFISLILCKCWYLPIHCPINLSPANGIERSWAGTDDDWVETCKSKKTSHDWVVQNYAIAK